MAAGEGDMIKRLWFKRHRYSMSGLRRCLALFQVNAVVVIIDGRRMWLWRAVDDEGEVLDGLTPISGPPEARCAVPDSDGASSILSRQEEDALWEVFFTAAPARRRVFVPSSKRRKRAPGPLPPATG